MVNRHCEAEPKQVTSQARPGIYPFAASLSTLITYHSFQTRQI